MWPLPLDSTPSFGCQAGPSPPAPPAASTFSLAPGAKIASSAPAAASPTTHARHAITHRMALLLSRGTVCSFPHPTKPLDSLPAGHEHERRPVHSRESLMSSPGPSLSARVRI